MKVNEIFLSLQGESTHAGLLCLFVRLTGCNLRCSWCDTTYSYDEGTFMTPDEIYNLIKTHKVSLVEFTGGEPWLQKDELIPVMEKLISENYTILLETNGSIDLSDVPNGVIKIIDVKLGGSGEGDTFCKLNLDYLTPKDELKFVISSNEDYHEVKKFIENNNLEGKVNLLFSPVMGKSITPSEIAEYIVRDRLPVRFQLQLHKYIWNDERGR